MNYLAHAYLSFGHAPVIVGNLVSDFIKGKKRYEQLLSIQIGIELHRRIDTFTDEHAITHEGQQIFQPVVGRYGGAFMDVVYDHFLANDTTAFQQQDDLKRFAGNVYAVLTDHYEHLPARFQQMLPYMKQHDWLFNYSSVWGIEKSFEGIVKRAAYLTDSKPAYQIFIEYYDKLQPLYDAFFPELKTYAFQQLQQLLDH